MGIYKNSKTVILPCVKKYLKAYISSHLDEIVPFEVQSSPDFQIRFSVEEYRTIPSITKSILKAFAITDIWDAETERNYQKWNKRYKKDFFWIPANAYIFNYSAKKGYALHTNCEYGYDGREKSTPIYFIDDNEFPPSITNNIGKNEKDPFIIKTRTRRQK